ncbi:MAG: rRNA pseudouridine synthase [Clostridiales bacterium]|nr:rRNA pseudouridine synthase [Clostridiales bacterium]
MIRLDKYLADAGAGTRTQVKELIRKGCVSVDGKMIRRPEEKVNEQTVRVTVNGTEYQYRTYRYFMLNKPAGVVSATEDKREKTVLDLFPEEIRKDLFPVGRLDKDTVGLLILTNDGVLAHNLLSPKKHVSKTYLVGTGRPVSEEELRQLRSGVDIGEKKRTLPAEAWYAKEKNQIYLSIREGKFHQIKRMLAAVDNEVFYLKRITMGLLTLDENLAEGSFRELTEEEIDMLYGIEVEKEMK